MTTETYVLIIYGDADGDGNADGRDALLVSCIADGLFTREQVGESKYLAADCDRDGEITADDVQLAAESGIFTQTIVQTK